MDLMGVVSGNSTGDEAHASLTRGELDRAPLDIFNT